MPQFGMPLPFSPHLRGEKVPDRADEGSGKVFASYLPLTSWQRLG
jgi:hypothetical protein